MEEKMDLVEGTSEVEKKEEKVDVGNGSNIKDLLKRINRLEILGVISVFLLSVILVISIINLKTPVPQNSQVSIEKALPQSIDKTVANKIINNIKDAYNSSDNNKMYDLMGEYAKTLVTFDDFEKSVKQIQILGKIENASYTHYTYQQYSEGADWYVLNYIVKYEAGAGNATVSIRVNDNSWEIVGFRFNVENVELKE